MHSAPSVSYPVGRSRFAAGLLSGCWLLGVAAVGLWSFQMRAAGWQLAASLGVLLLTGLWAAWNWLRAPQGLLSWDGQSWSWSAGAQAEEGTPEVGLDLQRWLLLRWSGAAASHWLWLQRARQPERWDDLRRAVYSRAKPQALRQDASCAAKP